MRSGQASAARMQLSAVSVAGHSRSVPACRRQLLFTIIFFLIVPRTMAGQPAEDLDATVRYLIAYVQESDVTFKRNSTRYNGVEAAEHIDRKYQHFKDDIDTPEKFIELCATGSLMTGKSYFIITRQGKQLPSSEWLHTELAAYRLRNEYTGP